MNIQEIIAKKKQAFHNARLGIIKRKTAKLQEANIKEAEVTEYKQKLREAEQIRADLKADQMKQVEGAQPSKLQRLGKGMAAHMNKTKAKKGRKIGVPRSVETKTTATSQGGIFGGQRNIEVGSMQGSPFVKKDKPKSLF